MRFNFQEDRKAKKEVLPVTFCEFTKGGRTYRDWRARSVPAPRPLYRLPNLLSSPDKPVIITEGEKKADRAVELFPGFESTTTMGGAEQPQLSDFGPLAGRRVIIWPDHDESGESYARKVAQLALRAGASEVAIVHVPDSFPTKWDLADEPPTGVSLDDLHRLLLDADVFRLDDEEARSDELPFNYFFTKRGLVWRDPIDAEKPELLLASRFDVLAETRDGDGCSWGVLLHWQDHDGRDHELALPRAMLAGDGTDARRILLNGGLYVAPGRKSRELLNAFLLSVRSSGRARATNRMGWHDRSFVLPDACFGVQGKDRLLLQGTVAAEHAFTTRGTLEDWNREVAQYARGNTRLLVAISAAFAAPLTAPC
jgi:hypothetical protein